LMINEAGNVGIGTGTTSPGAPLHVDGAWVGNHGQIAIEGPTDGLVGTALRSNGAYKGFIIYRDGSGGAKMEVGTVNDEPLHLQTNGHNNRLTILGGGNVGIGTVAPTSKLHVAGDINQDSNYILNSQTVNDLQTRSSYRFNDDVITVGTNVLPIDGELTLSAWIKSDGETGDYRTIIANRSPSGGSNFQLYLRITSGVLGYYNGTEYYGTYVPPTGKWTYVAATVDISTSGTVLTLYANGVSVHTATISNPTSNTSNVLTIGKYSGEDFIGEISQIRIYNRTLSATEVKDEYSGKALPYADTGAKVNYVSDFSAGVDGWVSSYGTGAGNIDNIGGKNDNFRYTSNTGSSNKIAHYVSDYEYTATDPHKPRLSFEIYFPSTNSHINGYQLKMGGLLTGVSTINSNVWAAYQTGYGINDVSTDNTLEFYFASSGSITFDDGGGDVVYLRNIKISTAGAMAEYLPASIGATTWLDTSGNALHGTVTGATQVGQNIFGGNVGIDTTVPDGKLDLRDGDLTLTDTDVSQPLTDFTGANTFFQDCP